MTTLQKIEWFIYAVVITLCVFVLVLAALSSSFSVDSRVVYQGF